jgi:hypothetical protein
MQQVTIEGVVYQARRSAGDSCNGCAGISFSSAACSRLPACGGPGTYIHWHKARVQPPAIPATPPRLPAPAACDIGPSLPSAWASLAGVPARKTDPATSKGKRKVNKYEQAVLDSLRFTKEGRTGKEIASDEEHPLNCITPRFAPLRRKGLIKDSGIKRDKQIVWVLA